MNKEPTRTPNDVERKPFVPEKNSLVHARISPFVPDKTLFQIARLEDHMSRKDKE